MKPYALMIHVEDPAAAVAWYGKAFPETKTEYLAEFDLHLLQMAGFSIEVVRADEKVGSGKKGTVLYWEVPNLAEEIERLEKLGASLYRGPMPIEDGLGMCQLADPFGNLLGLRGPFQPDAA